ncbi:MAG TPA: cytoplasmic chaperone TorD family protein [Desulfobacteraceae bacterium]|mgnify:CR=1 FL=1|nr:cytoplasmic chaperone TorD family protein [Desulfobacteraceae bacterium]|tara:strand:- start:119 stop:682 length:564 start_codon:yes stop_codon:yes gene_type:complete
MDPAEKTTLTLLRDFFLARSGQDLAPACMVLAGDSPAAARIGRTDWDEAEFAFNRLFVGPMALQAPPYASAYLETEPRLMGESTLKIRRIYEMAGLSSPLQGRLPDDHIGVELDAALGLSNMAQTLDAEEPRVLWRYFLHEHLSAWLPQFIDRARRAEAGHPAVDLALDHLETWLNRQQSKEEGKIQ